MPAELYRIPIAQRPSHGPWLNLVLFPLLFNAGMILINLTQLMFWPLSLLPPLRKPYAAFLRWTKTAFVRLLILMTVLFGQSTFVITAGEGVELESLVRRDMQGRPVGLAFSRTAVAMGNHQAYSDWMYVWIFAYLADASDGMFILLKKSLKWVPIVGWGMQFFDFIFLARRWRDDRQPLTAQLDRISADGVGDVDRPIWVNVWPEGTIVSEHERARSKAYADKVEIIDTTHVLLPHSLGLYTMLSHLTPLPDLPLIDLTIGYPGVPPAGQAQLYFNLITIWLKGVPPPEVHIHVRVFDRDAQPAVSRSSDLPAVDGQDREDSPNEAERKKAFGAWLLERWREKDDLMTAFYRDGHFPSGSTPSTTSSDAPVIKDEQAVRVPIAFRDGWWEAGAAFCWFAPVALGWLGWSLGCWLFG